LAAALAACGGGATDAPSGSVGPPSNVTLTAPPTQLTVVIGSTATTTLNFTRVNYDRPLTLSVSDLPSGITATLNPTSLIGSAVSTVLTVAAAADAVPSGSGGGGIITVSVKGDSLSLQVQIPLLVTRPQLFITRAGTGTGTVTSSPAGINCGSACNAAFAFGTSVTLTATPAAGSAFAGWSGNGCSGTSPTCTLTVISAPTIIATFNSTAQSFALGTPSTATVPQGGSGTATASITRTNGFAGALTLSSTGAPSGLTVTANPVNATDIAATLNVAAASSVAVGNYPITITATGSGVPSQITILHVQVTPASGGSGTVAISFATCDPSEVPIWLASQNGTGAWTRVTPGPNSTFTFAAGATGGIAWVTPDGTGFSTSVFYGNRQEITSIALGGQCSGLHASTGTTRLTGSYSGIATTAGLVSVGGASTQFAVPQSGPNFTLDHVPAGRRDLIAAAINITPSGGGAVQRLIVRRDVTYSGTIPTLNFTGPEFILPVLKSITTNNLNGDQTSLQASFVTANGSTAPYLNLNGNPAAVGFAGMPDSLLQPGDLHAIQIVAAAANGSSVRAAILLHHSAVGDTVAFGPSLNQPTITTLGTSPVVRPRAQLASQSAYNAAADAQFSQSANSVEVSMTAGYSGATPSTWSLDVPDLASAGYDPAWGLKSGSPVDWNVFAFAGDVLPFLGATPVDGTRITAAGVSNTLSASTQRRPFHRWIAAPSPHR
jgi:hypothetical protein